MKRYEAISVFRNLGGWKGPDLSFAAVVGGLFESLKERLPLTPAPDYCVRHLEQGGDACPHLCKAPFCGVSLTN